MKVKGSVALVTGANGGIGRAFVADLLERGAAKVYVGGRSEGALAPLLADGDPRVSPLVLDITDGAQVARAAAAARDVTLLVNNAGYSAHIGTLSTPDLDGARREMEVNYFGTLRMSRAFAPVLASAGGGAIVNVLSFLSLATLPMAGTYSASKAAALSLTRSLRAELAAQGTSVLASMPVQVDTPMGAWSTQEKVTPHEAASESLDALEDGETEVFPGGPSRAAADALAADPKGLQAMLSSLLPTAA